jgi:hypothetical protein
VTRQEAIAAGAKTYTGKVCAKHPELVGSRYTCKGGCPACAREQAYARRQDPITREMDRAHRQDPIVRKRSTELHREYYQNNREQRIQTSREYAQKNIEHGGPRGRQGAIGASAELLVAADLMVRGFGVTRPLNPSAVHDLHVEFPSVGWKGVQVKSVKVNTLTGRWIFNDRKERKSPIYALVRPSTKEVRYEAGSEDLPEELRDGNL